MWDDFSCTHEDYKRASQLYKDDKIQKYEVDIWKVQEKRQTFLPQPNCSESCLRPHNLQFYADTNTLNSGARAQIYGPFQQHQQCLNQAQKF